MNLIHIGLPKTASTTLQDRLFSKQDKFVYLGRFKNGYLSQTTKELLERLTFEDSLEYDQSIMNALLQRARSEMQASSRPIQSSFRWPSTSSSTSAATTSAGFSSTTPGLESAGHASTSGPAAAERLGYSDYRAARLCWFRGRRRQSKRGWR